LAGKLASWWRRAECLTDHRQYLTQSREVTKKSGLSMHQAFLCALCVFVDRDAIAFIGSLLKCRRSFQGFATLNSFCEGGESMSDKKGIEVL